MKIGGIFIACKIIIFFFLPADETYEALKKTFLPKGKGRPPDPPTVFLTNRLLLQFEVLKNEGRRTYKDVSKR